MSKQPKNLERIKRLANVIDNGNVAILDYINDLEDKIDSEIPSIKDVISRVKGDKGDSPTKEELREIIKPLIPKPIPGYTPTQKEIVELIKPLIPEIPEVKDGETPSDEKLISLIEPLIPEDINTDELIQGAKEAVMSELEEKIPKIEDIQNSLPKLANQIRDGLELLSGDDRLDKKAIRGIEQIEKRIDNAIIEARTNSHPRGGSANLEVYEDGIRLGSGAAMNFIGPNVSVVHDGHTANVIIAGGGGGSGESYNFTQSTPSTTWTITHNLGTENIIVYTYSATNDAMEYDDITFTDSNTCVVTFSGAVSGRAVVLASGGIANGVSAVSIATANGFTGSSSGGTTPTLTLNVDGTHYLPTTTDESNWNAKGTGSVTSVSVTTANGVFLL